MRRTNFVVAALTGAILGGVMLGNGLALAADSGPVIVLPGRNGLPVIINGVDVTGAVIEGDWGLYSPHMVGPRIIAAPVFIPRPIYRGGYDHSGNAEDGYYPALGHQPGYGRREIEPPADRRLPPPAPSFHRFWSSHSDSLPANLDAPPQPTPLIVAPQIYPGGRRAGDAPPRRP